MLGVRLLEASSAASLSAGRLVPTLFCFPHDAFRWSNFWGFCVFGWSLVIGSPGTDLGRIQSESERGKHAKEEDLQDIWPSPQCRGASEQQAQTHAGVVSRDRGSPEKLRHVKRILLPSS